MKQKWVHSWPRLCIAATWLLAGTVLFAQGEEAATQPTYRNPILPGFNPDPGFLRVGDDYYIVTSSFEYFPCFPIYHSKDLVNWEQIGNVLNRRSQINLDGIAPSDGLFSPVMRHHNGTYYLTYTMLKYVPQQRITNYLVTAKDPAGPWSDPIAVTDDSFWRIDTSLFFDDDGTCYFTANRKLPKGQRMIVLQEFDLKTFKLIGGKFDIGSGAFPNSQVAEGAHLYKRDGYYYLLLAEGGTGYGHAVSISRSRKISGPYEQCPTNPILTHRDLPRTQGMIHGVGHGEIVETQNGQCYMALLGTRGAGVLGRETFLVPVQWEKGQWPVIAPGAGRVLAAEPRPTLPECKWPARPAREEFSGPLLGPQWLFIRVPAGAFWSFDAKPAVLRMKLLPAKFNDPEKTGTPAFISKRLPFHDGELMTELNFTPHDSGELAGLLIRRGDNGILICKTIEDNKPVIRVSRETQGKSTTKGSIAAGNGPVYLKAECRDEVKWTCSCSNDGNTWTPIGPELDGSFLGPGAPGGVYTGTTAGPYATSQGKPSENSADFAFFECRENEP